MMLRIAPQDIESRLSKDNPWWQAGNRYHSQFKNSVRRDYFKPFFELATDFELKRASILLGPRRVGKTVILYQMIDELLSSGENPRNILYVSIDSPVYAGIPLENFLNYIIDRSKGDDARFFVLYDEIQYLKDWEIHLKDLVDRYQNVKFIASGSAAAALQLKSQESGAGRFSDSLLPPLTFLEFVKFLKREDLLELVEAGIYKCADIDALNVLFIEYLNFGGFPELALSKKIRSSTDQFIKNDIIDKVLLKDLPNLYGIQNIGELNKLFSFLAYNTGQEASLEAISQNSGLSKGAITNYISYLNSAFLISTLPKLPSSSKGILRQRSFKVYLTNPSMRSALFGEVNAENSELIGHLAEAAILSQLDHISRINSYHYFRDKHGNEVDLVRTNLGTFHPANLTEVKWSDRISPNSYSDLRSVLSLARKSSLNRITATSRTKNASFEVDGITVTQLPTSLYCLNLGFLASKAAIDINWRLVQDA